ncbi:folate-binding protein YgfZ [Dyella sp. ASV21]|uniref:CAF17-like 4Fe-4S cluster assembly/insertion protein YgfZ n=1 Tax=Dyella sp. ASV21 TaxID=2795114 RepID=UPI0018EBC7B9|nr:folate-binding protein YgfZ [Dyella sp. ASV21]
MTPHYPAHILQLEGADAIAFAHAQFTSNVRSLQVGQWQFSAWLDAQGRVLALFHLGRPSDDALLVLLRGGDAASLAQSLQRFVFRSKVKLTVLPVQTLGTAPARESYALHREGGAYIWGCGSHSLVTGAATSDDDWRLPQIHAGWPWLPTAALGELLPPALSLERLQAVAFDKGCYPGQEIVARLHYRGGHKRHMHCVVLSQRLTEGTVLRQDGKGVAQLLDIAVTQTDVQALAVLDDEVVKQLENGVVNELDEGISLRVTKSWSA